MIGYYYSSIRITSDAKVLILIMAFNENPNSISNYSELSDSGLAL